MLKIKNFIHTLSNIFLYLIFASILFYNTKPNYYEGWSFSDAISNSLKFYTFTFFLYISTGILFDFIIYWLENKKGYDLVSAFRLIFIFIAVICTLILIWMIYILSGWTGQM